MHKIVWDEGTIRSARPRVKRLTMFDLASRMRDDEDIKTKLAKAVGVELRRRGHDEPELDGEVYAAIHLALLELSGAPRARYHIQCDACGTHEVLETGEPRPVIRYTCCGCARSGEVVLPEGLEILRCPDCGIETQLRKVDLEV